MEDPVEAVSEGTIGAVVNIAGYEVWLSVPFFHRLIPWGFWGSLANGGGEKLVDSNAERFAMHMRGLFRMIGERGGMVTLRKNANLEDIIVR